MQFYQLTKRLNTRSFDRVFLRLYTIARRYGWTPAKYEAAWFQMMALCQKQGIRPTFPVTACVVKRHPHLFIRAKEMGAEFAVHGLRHIDYTHLCLDTVMAHARHGLDIFKMNGLEAQGFRYPYLRSSQDNIACLKEAGYGWDSSEACAWHGLKAEHFSERVWGNYQNILSTYEAMDHQCSTCLPWVQDGFVELPVALPDDDMLIERLELKDDARVEAILVALYRAYRERGDALVLQMHPERFPWFQRGLTLVLEEAARDSVWMASLDAMADWWRHRFDFQMTWSHEEAGWALKLDALPEARLEIWRGDGAWVSWHGDSIDSMVKPVVGLNPNHGADWETLLKNEGLPFERVLVGDSVSLRIPEALNQPPTRAEFLRLLSQVNGPLVRYARWPLGRPAALAVSGDIDGVDLWDFWERFRG